MLAERERLSPWRRKRTSLGDENLVTVWGPSYFDANLPPKPSAAFERGRWRTHT